MNQDNQCSEHKNNQIESICVKESCCNKLKCPECKQVQCKVIKLRLLNDRFKQFKDDLNKIVSFIDNYNKNLPAILQQNKYENIVQDIFNTENAIFMLKEHINIINTRSINQQIAQIQQGQKAKYQSNLQCTRPGHEQFQITCINLQQKEGEPFLLCNYCHTVFQFAKDFNNIKKLCEDYINLKEIKEIQILQQQQYDQYLKKFKQLSILVEDQTMYNYIKDKLTYFDNPNLRIIEMFDDKFIEFLRSKVDKIDDNTKQKLLLIKNIMQKNNIDKLDINTMENQLLHKFNVDYKFRNDPIRAFEEVPYFGPKLMANLNYIQLVTIYDPMIQVKGSKTTIRFFDEKDNTLEQFTVEMSGAIIYGRQKLDKFEDHYLPDKFIEQIDEKSHLYKINFFLFLGKEMQKYILLSYQGQMMLKQLQNWRGLKYFQVSVKLIGESSYGRIVTQQY